MKNFYLTVLNFNLIFLYLSCCNAQSLDLKTTSECTTGTASSAPQYYDTITLSCKACSQNGTVMSQTSNVLGCRCNNGFRLSRNVGNPGSIACIGCPANQVTSLDGWSCVTCGSGTTYDADTRTCSVCAGQSVATDRDINGQPLGEPNNLQNCTTCVAGTSPAVGGGRCTACVNILATLNSQGLTSTDCACTTDGHLVGGVCIPGAAQAISTAFTVQSTEKPPSLTTTSEFFQRNLISSYILCQNQYNNVTACQTITNMCVLLLYKRTGFSTATGDACAMYYDLYNNQKSKSTVTGFLDWRIDLPWLYYESTTASRALESTEISQQYGRNSQLQFLLAEYAPNGTFLGLVNATNGRIQLCRDSLNELNAAYVFGTNYLQTCTLSLDDLFQSSVYPLTFYDPYLEFTDTNNIKKLLPIPVRVLNLLSRSSIQPNLAADYANWRLVRRFFLVDNMAARKAGNPVPEMVRYAKSITLTIRPQASSDGTINKEGKIQTPYFTIEYDFVKASDRGAGRTVTVSFSVVYSSVLTRFNYDLSVAMGVLCALAFCFAAVRTWSWTRRAGVVAFDVVTILKLLAHNASAIGNVFLLVTASTSIYYLLFYKNQITFAVFLPTADQENIFVIYISVAFVLKIFDIIHIFVSQCTVDIFFVDWERGRAKTGGPQQAGTGENGNDKAVEESSIWRTYFCANEWNEIQTYRKVNRSIQLMICLFFLEVIGLIRYASADTVSNRFLDNSTYRAPDSLMFRYALIVMTYTITAVVLWAFHLLIYEKFFEDKLRNYVDLCSVANISVFVMAHKQFGYYIHGQSVHGTADVGLKSMYKQLEKEKENLCAKRGLEADSDQQTFMMALPTDMRENFDRLYAPFAEGRNVEKGLETYNALNKFLSQFISRGDSNMKFRIVDRRLLEDVLDCEFDDCTIEGHFYKDDGNSFGNVLFYNHELSLSTLDLLTFVVVDLIFRSVILDCIIVWLFGKILDMMRDNFGRKNLARKTLVDDRFLI